MENEEEETKTTVKLDLLEGESLILTGKAKVACIADPDIQL